MASPVSLALSCFGINKFIPGASHDLRFTIGQQGQNLKKSIYTELIPPAPNGQTTVLDEVAQAAATVTFGGLGGKKFMVATSCLTCVMGRGLLKISRYYKYDECVSKT